ncbi:MAG: cytochrome P450 [Pseudomonadota bacterium]|nr:cytochrome P450 [Pseudomonadota bacterium]
MTDTAAPPPASPSPDDPVPGAWVETPAERAKLERDLLYLPDNPPPSLDRLAASPLLRRINTLRTIRRASRNLLDMVHPDLADRRWHAVKVGPELVITVNDPDFARHVLQGNAGNYVKGRFYEIVFAKFLGASSLTLDGAAWRQRRRLISPAFNARAIRGVEEVVTRHAEAMLDGWRAAARGAGPGGAVVDLGADVSGLAMRVAMEAFFSSDMGDETARIGRLMDVVITDAGSPPFADVMGLGRWAPRRSRKAGMAALAELDAWLLPRIDARLARREGGEPEAPDLLDILVHARDEETGALLDRQAIRNEVLTLFSAGHETTALSLVWGLDRLSREPAWQDRLAQAAAAAAQAAGGPLDPAAARGVAELPAAYDELLRLYPPAYSSGRQAVEDARFEDLEIPAGTRVQVVIGLIHRNRRFWETPGVFDPGRFLGEAKAGRHPFAHIPFGAGPRICVGLALARLEGLMTLARALPDLRLLPDGPPPEPLGKITLRTKGPARMRVALR